MKRVYSILIALVLCMNGVTTVFAEDDTIKIYVSCDGNDANAGTENAPLKTLEGARNKVRNIKNEKAVEVIFREGEYRFSEGVDFTSEDSGTESTPITYKVAEGEKVVFKGSHAFDADMGEAVTDKDILERVEWPARNYLVQYDLKKLGYNYELPAVDKIQQFQFLMYPEESEYINLFLDDKEQAMSQWPNGDDEYVSWVEAIEKGNGINQALLPGSFRYSGNRPDRWEKADSFWIGGYPGYNFRYERNSVDYIDTENSIIKLATNTCFGLISEESKAWKVFNLLEEIDMPGEWFVDRKTMILYYYPPYSLKDKTLEISFLKDPFFNFKGASYINVEGIEFSEHRATAILGTVVSNINIENCTFKNIDGTAIKTQGDIRTTYSWSRWQNAAKEFHVRNCTFDNIGGSAILLKGGNIDTLERGNCSFKNNMIMRVSAKSKNQEAINLRGVGNTVKNNNLSSGSFHAITYGGSYHTISNNEFYDVNKCADDVGVVYAGRDYVARGTEIAYNYIHDNAAHRNISGGFMVGIYWDDSQPGQYAHHNIIVNNPVTFFASGHSNDFKNNTIINSTQENMRVYYRNGWSMGNEHTELLADKDIYFKAFPEMETTLASKYEGKLAYCDITGNLSVNSGENNIQDLYSEWFGYSNDSSHVQNNVEMDECNDFVNPEMQDYRLKSDSDTAKKMSDILNESFDIEEIGVVGRSYEFNEETATFKKLYPHNGQGAVKANEVEFMWERVFGANDYRLVVAKDKEMTDIVYDAVVPYNIQKVEGIERDTEYYWQVWANNTSRKYSSTWLSNSEPYTFSTMNVNSVTNFPTGNLLENSGFETGDFTGWQTDDSGVFTVVNETFEGANGTKDVVHGNYALRAAATDATSGYIYQEIEASKNTNYVLNASWFDLTTAEGSIKVYGDSVAEENLIKTAGNLFGGETWYSTTVAFNSGEYEKLIIRIDAADVSGSNYFCIDNLALRTAGNTQTIDFENGFEGLNIMSKKCIEITNQKANGGEYALKLSSGDNWTVFNIPFALNNNQYCIKFDYYIETGKLGVRIKYGHGNGWSEYSNDALKSETLTTTGSWQTFETPVYFPQSTNNFVELAFQNMETDTVVYIDNIKCESVFSSVDSITITGGNKEGETLHAEAECYNYGYGFKEPVTYQWQISDDKKIWADVNGATEQNYNITYTDSEKYLRVKVTTTNRYSSSASHAYYSKPIKIAEIEIGKIVLTNSAGTEIKKLTDISDGVLKAEISISALTKQNVFSAVAVYDESGRLCNIDARTDFLATGEDKTLNYELTLPTDGSFNDKFEFKAFIWDENNKPLTDVQYAGGGV